MRYPPSPIDPSKPWKDELVRYAVGMYRYRKALENGENDHGPWQRDDLPLVPMKSISYVQKRNIDAVNRIGDIGETYAREGVF